MGDGTEKTVSKSLKNLGDVNSLFRWTGYCVHYQFSWAGQTANKAYYLSVVSKRGRNRFKKEKIKLVSLFQEREQRSCPFVTFSTFIDIEIEGKLNFHQFDRNG